MFIKRQGLRHPRRPPLTDSELLNTFMLAAKAADAKLEQYVTGATLQ